MPNDRPRVHCPSRFEREREIQTSLKLSARSIEILRRCPEPDNFLGRKVQDAFPKEDEG